MKTIRKNFLFILIIIAAVLSFSSCGKDVIKKTFGISNQSGDEVPDSLKMVGDSTDIYGKGYFKYQDSIETFHMGYSIPRDSAYKVENIKAFEHLNYLIQQNPTSPGPYLDRGNHFQNIQKYQEAIADYDKYIEQNQKNYSAYQNRGTAHERLKHFDMALNDYTKVIELKPRDTIAYFNRGCVWDFLTKYSEAIKEYDTVLYIDPRLAKAYYNRVADYEKIRDYDKAIRDFTKAVELNPQYKEELVSRIELLKRR